MPSITVDDRCELSQVNRASCEVIRWQAFNVSLQICQGVNFFGLPTRRLISSMKLDGDTGVEATGAGGGGGATSTGFGSKSPHQSLARVVGNMRQLVASPLTGNGGLARHSPALLASLWSAGIRRPRMLAEWPCSFHHLQLEQFISVGGKRFDVVLPREHALPCHR